LTIFIVRTYKPFYKSHPGRMLLLSASVIGVLTVLLPYSPAAAWFGLVPLPLGLLGVVLSISLLYMATAEWVKRGFYRKRPIKPRPLRRRGDP